MAATEALDLTMGVRYTIDGKALDSAYSNPSGSLGCASYFGPNGRVSPAALGRIATALTARGLPFTALAAAQQQAIVSNIVGFTCLPPANPLHNGRATYQERDEKEWWGTLRAAYR